MTEKLHREIFRHPPTPNELQEAPLIGEEPLIQVDPRPQEFQGFVDRNRLYVDLISGKDVNYILLREESPGYLRSLMVTGTLEIDGNIARLPEVQRKNREEEARARSNAIHQRRRPRMDAKQGRSWLERLRMKGISRSGRK